MFLYFTMFWLVSYYLFKFKNHNKLGNVKNHFKILKDFAKNKKAYPKMQTRKFYLKENIIEKKIAQR